MSSPGLPWPGQVRDHNAEGVYRPLAESLERSGPDACPAPARLRAEGAVRAIGASTHRTETPTRFVAETDLDRVLVTDRCSCLDRGAALELPPLCVEGGVDVMVGGVFGSGSSANPPPGATCGCVPAVASQIPPRHPDVSTVVVEARGTREATGCARHASVVITEALWAELDALEMVAL